MRKLLAILMLFGGMAAAQTTPNLHLNVPDTGTPDWGTLMNENFTILDTAVSTGGGGVPTSLKFGALTINLGSGAPSVTNCLVYDGTNISFSNICGSGGGGSMTWPTGGAGIPLYSGFTSWGTTITTSAGLAAVLSDETGSGALVFGTAPVITLPNATGLPLATGITGFGTNVATFLATPTSANLAAAITNETGTGLAVFGTSPALLGTPDASGASQFKLPIGVGFATAADGEIGYDTTNKNWHFWKNGADALGAVFSGALTSGHCGQILVSGGVTSIVDAGIGCAGGSTTWSNITDPSPANLSINRSTFTSIFNTTAAQSQFFAWKNTTAAVVGTSQGSPIPAICGRAFHGSADVEDCMTLSELPGNGNDAAITFNVGHTGSSTGVVTTQFPGPISAGLGGSVGGSLLLPEGTSTAGTSGNDLCYGDSTAHAMKCSFNNDTAQPLTRASSTSTTTTDVLHATATAGVYAPSAIATGDLPSAIPIGKVGSAGLSGTAPVSVASTGVISLSGATGQVPNGATGAFTATPALGASGTVGTVSFGNATSGTVTLGTVTGALGAVTASLPANTGTISETNLAETFSAVKTFSSAPVISAITNTGTLTLPTATGTLGDVIASGTSAMGTGAISSGTCATVVTTSATNTATTDTIIATPNADPTGVTGYAVSATGSLYIQAYPTANNVNFKVCNNTSGSLTPAALTLNWRVIR